MWQFTRPGKWHRQDLIFDGETGETMLPRSITQIFHTFCASESTVKGRRLRFFQAVLQWNLRLGPSADPKNKWVDFPMKNGDFP